MRTDQGKPGPVCKRVREALLDAKGDVNSPSLEAVRRHLEECEQCRHEVQSVERLLQMAHQGLHSDAPPDVCSHLEQVLSELPPKSI